MNLNLSPHEDHESRPAPELGVSPATTRNLLLVGGVIMLAITGGLAWGELSLSPEYLVFATPLAALGLLLARREWLRVSAGVALAGATLVSALLYALVRSPMYLGAEAVGFVSVLVAYLAPARVAGGGTRTWLFGLLAVCALALSWSAYFHFGTAGALEETLSRRLILTFGWLAVGLGGVLGGRRSLHRLGGLGFVGAALLKAALYDTSHLEGGLRLLSVGVSGALCLGAAGLLARRHARATVGA